MTGNLKTTLSSACRCGYPEKVTWDQFKEHRKPDCGPDPLKHLQPKHPDPFGGGWPLAEAAE